MFTLNHKKLLRVLRNGIKNMKSTKKLPQVVFDIFRHRPQEELLDERTISSSLGLTKNMFVSVDVRDCESDQTLGAI